MLFATACLCAALLQPQVRTCTAQGSDFKLVDVQLDYGNGTRKWTSCILQSDNDAVYNATQSVATSLNVTWYDGSAFVGAIDGVWNSYPYYWMWLRWTGDKWEYGSIGADKNILLPNEIKMWRYEKPNYNP